MGRICKRLDQKKEDQIVGYLNMNWTYDKIMESENVSPNTIRKIAKIIQQVDQIEQEEIQEIFHPEISENELFEPEDQVYDSDSDSNDNDSDSNDNDSDSNDNDSDSNDNDSDSNSNNMRSLPLGVETYWQLLKPYFRELNLAAHNYIAHRKGGAALYPYGAMAMTIKRLEKVIVILETMLEDPDLGL